MKKHNEITEALIFLTKSGEIKNGWVVKGESYHLADGDSVTEQQLNDAVIAITEEKEKREAIKLSRSQIAAAFDSLPSYIKWPYREQFNVASEALDAGDYEGALAVIEYAKPFPEFIGNEKESVFNEVKADMKSRIEALKSLAEES